MQRNLPSPTCAPFHVPPSPPPPSLSRYQPGTDLYECRPDKKLRAPAWCDRVLWCATNHPNHIKQINYGRTEHRISDHKPVYACFETAVKNIVIQKRTEVYGEVMRTLDKFENQSLPKVDLNKSSVDFGTVFYNNKATETIQVSGSGARSEALFWRRFADRLARCALNMTATHTVPICARPNPYIALS